MTDIEEREIRLKTTWIFNPARSQWRNSKAERKIKTLKRILRSVLAARLNPQLQIDYDYSQLQGILAHICSIMNDRPIDLKCVTDDLLCPVTINMILLGRQRQVPAPDVPFTEESKHFQLQSLFIADLEKTWWKKWREQSLSQLLPFHAAKDVKKSKNLEVGDVVMLLSETKIACSYRLAKVVEAVPSPNDGCVRTVRIAYLPNNVLKKSKNYNKDDFVSHEYAVQSLVLFISRDEIDRRFWRDSEEDDLMDRLLDPQGYDKKTDEIPADETDVKDPPVVIPDDQPSDVDPSDA